MKEIQLTRGCVALVDEEDFEILNLFEWRTASDGYAIRTLYENGKKIGSIAMHRQIIGTPKGLETDHINGQKRDNRKCNLRMATSAENKRNRGFQKNNELKLKGVSFLKKNRVYGARIKIPTGKQLWLGCFPTPQAAYAAYCEAAKRLHGEFCPDFIEANCSQPNPPC